jgi:hypothetical protein
MGDSEKNPPNTSGPRIRHYADILNPLFWHDDFYQVDRLFEWGCTLVRAAGLKDTGWDSYNESLALLEDLTNLQEMDLPTDRFPVPSHTQARLALISYCHVLEMNFPYELLSNLLRLRVGLKYSIGPLSHLDRPIEKKVNGVKVVQRVIAASPDKKIKEIEALAGRAGLPEVGSSLRSIYNSVIRNAVYHSDYAIHDGSMRLLSGNFLSKKRGVYTPLITFDELAEVTNDAFAFHSALLALYKRARNTFTDFRDCFLPYDPHYKGILEFTFDGDTLTGFRTYWPNGTIGMCCRALDGQSYAQNIRFNPDGSVNFMVGILASRPGTFSPCVEEGAEPIYATVPGTDKRPYWPIKPESYRL